MKKSIFINTILLMTFCLCNLAIGEVIPDINTILMRSTFKIELDNKSGGTKVGTVFILGKPFKDNHDKARYVLITAHHVLDKSKGEKAIIYLRKREGESFIKFPHEIRIRENNKQLWVKHPDADVAAMYIGLPKNVDILLATTNLLATDEAIQEYELYPSRELFILGYPLGVESSEGGFPVLRGGRISSYPLIPTKKTKIFLIDFEIFGGNSGGPVYFHDPDWHKRGSGAVKAPEEVHIIMGVVSKKWFYDEQIQLPKGMETTLKKGLGLAVVIHASFINETLELLENK